MKSKELQRANELVELDPRQASELEGGPEVASRGRPLRVLHIGRYT